MGLASAAVATALLIWGPNGVDLPSHRYLLGLFRQDGLSLWDNRWYDGHYAFVDYSLDYYPLAAVLGIGPLAVISLALESACFAWVMRLRFGPVGRLPAWVNALCWGLVPLASYYPFALGATFAALAVALLAGAARQKRARAGWKVSVLVGLLATLCVAASPLALAFLWLVVLAVAASEGRRARWLLPAMVAMLFPTAAELVEQRLFADFGRYPFWWVDLMEVLIFVGGVVALAPWKGRSRDARALVLGAGLLGLLALFAFVVPSDLGANVARGRAVALPVALLVGGLARWRKRLLIGLAIIAATWWNLTPLVSAWTAGRSEQALASSSSWAPVISFLKARLTPSYRVEAVDTESHWAADVLPAAGIALVRGWYRQDDFPTNALLYASEPLTARSYLSWLRSQGVSYVVVSTAAPDFSSVGEKALVLSGRSGLRLVMSDRRSGLSVFAVPSPRPIVTGPAPARLDQLSSSSLVVQTAAPGTYQLVIHWSRYWQSSVGCLKPAPDGMTDLVVPASGRVTIRIHPTMGALWESLWGIAPHGCPVPD